jgi:hypothetical protein
MIDGMKYGDVALGVESALPAFALPTLHFRRRRGYLTRLFAALRRWA